MSNQELTTVEQAQDYIRYYRGNKFANKLAQDYIKVLAENEELRANIPWRKLKADRDALLADKERLDKLLTQGIYLGHMSRKLNDRAHIDAHLSKLDDAHNSEKERK